MITTHETEIRVRYQETDAQGRVHHANYLTWFELGRVELLRANGMSYKSLEATGIHLVIAEANVKYFIPADFDDLLTIKTTVTQAKGARILHSYQVLRVNTILAEGFTVAACIDHSGRVTRLPEVLRLG